MEEQRTISGYHAHVYYDAGTRERAAQIRDALGANFDVRLGRWHDRPVGPHPQAMYQVVFGPAEFARIVPWLMLNRTGLNVLVHPETGDEVADHTAHALWLGNRLELNIDVLRR
jgi:aromatic ring-cleaving dioxygenase